MYCKHCGANILEGETVCNACGNPVQPQQKAVNTSNQGIFIALGFVFPVIALLFIPPVFGGLGIWFGFVVKGKGNVRLGVALIVINFVCMIVGMILGAMLAVQ